MSNGGNFNLVRQRHRILVVANQPLAALHWQPGLNLNNLKAQLQCISSAGASSLINHCPTVYDTVPKCATVTLWHCLVVTQLQLEVRITEPLKA